MLQKIGQRKMHSILIMTFASFTGFLAAAETSRHADVERTWQNDTGEYKLTAKLLDFKSEKVQLEKEDGSKIWVPLKVLSSADQAYVKTHAAKLKRQSANPFDKGIAPPADAAKKELATATKELKPVRKRVAKSTQLYGINWYEADDAVALARQQSKPQMWFRVLGDLNGFM